MEPLAALQSDTVQAWRCQSACASRLRAVGIQPCFGLTNCLFDLAKYLPILQAWQLVIAQSPHSGNIYARRNAYTF